MSSEITQIHEKHPSEIIAFFDDFVFVFCSIWIPFWPPFWHHFGTLEIPKPICSGARAQDGLQEAFQTDLGSILDGFWEILEGFGRICGEFWEVFWEHSCAPKAWTSLQILWEIRRLLNMKQIYNANLN